MSSNVYSAKKEHEIVESNEEDIQNQFEDDKSAVKNTKSDIEKKKKLKKRFYESDKESNEDESKDIGGIEDRSENKNSKVILDQIRQLMSKLNTEDKGELFLGMKRDREDEKNEVIKQKEEKEFKEKTRYLCFLGTDLQRNEIFKISIDELKKQNDFLKDDLFSRKIYSALIKTNVNSEGKKEYLVSYLFLLHVREKCYGNYSLKVKNLKLKRVSFACIGYYLFNNL